jgi:hypothetical protein
MVKILEFKEFKTRLRAVYEDEVTPDAADAPAPPAAAPPPPPAMPAPDLGAGVPPAMPPDPNAPPAAAAGPTEMKFVFIKDAVKKPWHGHHDSESGGTKRLVQYSVTKEELEKWLEVHEFEAESELVMAALAGKRTMPLDVYKKFKAEVKDGSLGSDRGTTDIKFDTDSDFDQPSTSDLDIVFLKSK